MVGRQPSSPFISVHSVRAFSSIAARECRSLCGCWMNVTLTWIPLPWPSTCGQMGMKKEGRGQRSSAFLYASKTLPRRRTPAYTCTTPCVERYAHVKCSATASLWNIARLHDMNTRVHVSSITLLGTGNERPPRTCAWGPLFTVLRPIVIIANATAMVRTNLQRCIYEKM